MQVLHTKVITETIENNYLIKRKYSFSTKKTVLQLTGTAICDILCAILTLYITREVDEKLRALTHMLIKHKSLQYFQLLSYCFIC